MKTLTFVAAMAAALSLGGGASAAFAQAPVDQTGHYEWRAAQQYGPRATLKAPERVWVSNSQQMANCDCAMMKANADACMTRMHGAVQPSSPASVG